MNNPILALNAITKDFHDGDKVLNILQGVDLEVHPGESVAILGQSGSGKSTLLHILGMLDKQTSGEYHFEGTETKTLSERRRNRIRNLSIGFVFQHFHLLPELTVTENLLLPTWVAASRGGAGVAKKMAQEILDTIGLSDRANFRPAKLSGGEQQRLAIARALINRPKLLLCDEPTGNLDRQTAENVIKLLFAAARQGSDAMVLVTHDEEIAAQATRRLLLKEGKLHPLA
ncbi:MAG: ABC transporter ATP-binding protein [Planctomycetes bacterium]|nr:ABC transporter ATP-binding protein [Planctomycetota bacterium]